MLAICGPGWKSVPGTCQGRGGMLAICGAGWKSVPGTESTRSVRTRVDLSSYIHYNQKSQLTCLRQVLTEGSVAKWLRQRIANPPRVGSTPTGASFFFSAIRIFPSPPAHAREQLPFAGPNRDSC